MRKHLFVFFIIALAALAPGCILGNGSPTPEPSTPAPTTTQAPTTTPAPATTVPPTTTGPVETRAPEEHGDIGWQAYDDAVAKAEEEGGYLFFYFWRDQCPFCVTLSSDTFRDPDVVSYLAEHFGAVEIDIWSSQPISEQDPSLTGASLNMRYRPPGVPSMAVLDTDGTVIAGVSGYKTADDLLLVLSYAVSGAYREMSLSAYVASQDAD